MKRETWGTNEQATFDFTTGAAPTATVTDVLQQVRHYTFHMPPTPAAGKKLEWYSQRRAHVDTMTEDNVDVANAPYGKLPSSIPVPLSTPATTPVSKREYKFSYNDEDDSLAGSSLTNGWRKQLGYGPAGDNMGKVPNSYTVSNGGSGAGAGSMASKAASADSLNIQLNFRSQSAYLDSISAGGKKIEAKEPERNTLSPQNNNSVSKTGLPKTVDSSGGTGSGGKAEAHYPDPSPSLPLWKRGRPDYTTQGSDKLMTKFDYPDELTTKITDPQNVVTEIHVDTWGRPSHVTVTGPDQQLDFKVDYDATGRVHEQRRKQGSATILTTYEYDIVGRVKSVVTTGLAAAAGATTTATAMDDYSSFSSGTVKHTSPGGAVTTTFIDRLGRPKRVETKTGAFSSDIVSVTETRRTLEDIFYETVREGEAMTGSSASKETAAVSARL